MNMFYWCLKYFAFDIHLGGDFPRFLFPIDFPCIIIFSRLWLCDPEILLCEQSVPFPVLLLILSKIDAIMYLDEHMPKQFFLKKHRFFFIFKNALDFDWIDQIHDILALLDFDQAIEGHFFYLNCSLYFIITNGLSRNELLEVF